MTTNLCIHHADADGFASAAVIQYNWGMAEIDFVAVQYGDSPPDCSGKDVIIVDFSYPREVLLKLEEEANSLKVFDHHKSAIKELEGLDFCVFDISKAACIIVWEYYFPNDDIPLFLRYVADRDIWEFKLPDSKAHSLGLQSLPLDIEQYNLKIQDNSCCKNIISDGKIILRYQRKQIDSILSRDLPMVEIAGYKVPCINHTDGNTLSEVCGEISKNYPFAACYFDTGDKRVFNLRSRENFDVSKVAKLFGGGGHHHAAGFSIPLSEKILQETP
jgi:oligoribonuclease NrnB/cAMP/cGMP phosphodiesterase (DHH superfamily)